MMNRYVTLQQLGDGTYGSVVLGQRVDTGEKVSLNFKIENRPFSSFRVVLHFFWEGDLLISDTHEATYKG